MQYPPEDTFHVYPVNDLMHHTVDTTPEVLLYTTYRLCPCGPDVTYYADGDVLISHHSLDGREQTEHLPRILRPLYRFVHRLRYKEG